MNILNIFTNVDFIFTDKHKISNKPENFTEKITGYGIPLDISKI